MRCLVTGGCGFIGTRLVNKLSQEHQVTSIDLKASKRPLNKKVTYRFLDINEIDNVYDEFDIIFHLAAVSSIGAATKNPIECYRTNVLGTTAVLEKARRDKSQVIFASTCAIYNDKGEISDKILSHYQSSKLMGELLCQSYSNVKTKIFRIFNVYGPGDNKGVVSIFCHQREKLIPLTIAGDGTALRDYIHVDDVVDVMTKVPVMGEQTFPPADLCTGVLTSINELAKMFETQSINIPLPLEQSYNSPRKEPPIYLCGHFRKLNLYVREWFEEKAEEFVPF